MKSNKYLWIMMIIVILLAGCGGSGDEEVPLAPTSVPSTSVPPTQKPDVTPTLSASEHVKLGLEYLDQGELDQAITEFEKAIALDPNRADAHRNLGTAYGKQGNWEESIAAYEKAIKINPDFGEAYGDMAGAYFKAGKLNEAITAGEKGIELAPDYAMSYNNLGIAYGSQGKIDMAIDLFEKAIQADPNSVDAYYNLGFAYEQIEQFDQAIAAYQKAISVDPNYLDAYENLGVVYANQGQIAEAIDQLETFLKLAPPDHPDRTQVEGWLTELGKATAAKGSEYKNTTNGYSLTYPEGWYYIENGDRVGFAPSQADYESTTLKSLLVTLLVTPLDQTAQGMGLDQGAAPSEFLQVIASRLGTEIGEMDSIQVAGYPAAVAATSGNVTNSPFKGNMLIILVDERVFLVDGIAPPDQWDTVRPTFVDMVNSFVFFEPE
jgi:tetratricopeptide (TPR) repeat protein